MKMRISGYRRVMLAALISLAMPGRADEPQPSIAEEAADSIPRLETPITLPLPPGLLIDRQIDELIGYARQYTGTPYGRGSKGPARFDCSGFMQYVFKHFAYSLNASSAAQYLQGISVKNDHIRRGDLVFFAGRNANLSRVGHVGMVTEVYPDGNFKFIHASTSNGIREDWSYAPYYAKRYIGARRIFLTHIDTHFILDAIIQLEEDLDDEPFGDE